MSASHVISSPSYRPEIDGLRAVAVLPVVFYHYGVTGFPGGFVGVDIFFVISGFLIGGLLWSELTTTGRIHLGAFFGRRIRRLAPAYLVMALATFGAAWFILLPFDFREFGQQLVAATVYLANVHFFREAGYFATASDQKLMLHTWSLAVEEQFYLFLPILMLLLARVRRLQPPLLILLGVGSLTACLAMMQYSPTAAFYLFPFRAWELLIGVTLAIYGHIHGFAWRLHAALSWIGLGLILVAVLGFSAGDHFPGLYAAVPVAGAALIILNGRHDNAVNRLLCSRAFLFCGLISYSLYLWHWPLITLVKYYFGETYLPPEVIAATSAVSVVLSWLSYKLVESPLRHGALPGWRLPLAYAASSGAVIAIALNFAFSDGKPGRFTTEAYPFIAATRDFNQNWSRCTRPTEGPWVGLEICPIGPEGPPKVLVWGDSHARAFKEGLEQAAFDAGTSGLLIWRGGCPPLLGIWKDEKVSTIAEEIACARSGDLVMRGLAGTPSIGTVLLIGRWNYYVEGTGIGVDADNWVKLGRAGETDAAPDQKAFFTTVLQDTVAQLGTGDKRVFLLRQMPEIAGYTSRIAARDIAYGRASAGTVMATAGRIDRLTAERRSAAADAALQATALPPGRIVDLWDRVCDTNDCSVNLNGKLIYFDNNHVTNSGAIALRDGFQDVFAPD